MENVEKHSQASLYPNEIVTFALLFVLKGVGNRAFYRWLIRDYHHFSPRRPRHTRRFRLFNHWCGHPVDYYFARLFDAKQFFKWGLKRGGVLVVVDPEDDMAFVEAKRILEKPGGQVLSD